MEWGLPCRTSLWAKKSMFWFCYVLFYIAGGKGERSHGHSTLGVAAPHLSYTCPVGATAKLVCSQRGAALHAHDFLKYRWVFTSHSKQPCTGLVGPRKTALRSHGNHSLPPGLQYGSGEQSFWVTLQNVTHEDEGHYCCVILDIEVEHNHGTVVQKPHSHVVLHVTPRRNGSQNCTISDPTTPGGSVPVALAIAACILALLSLPLILVLVYKQRHSAQSSRRAQELVRMDSEALGHENPVFLGESPRIKTRTVSQIMTRQSSETGRHLLSEPGTPLSPPAHGDVFFPIEDTIPESPDFLQV